MFLTSVFFASRDRTSVTYKLLLSRVENKSNVAGELDKCVRGDVIASWRGHATMCHLKTGGYLSSLGTNIIETSKTGTVLANHGRVVWPVNRE